MRDPGHRSPTILGTLAFLTPVRVETMAALKLSNLILLTLFISPCSAAPTWYQLGQTINQAGFTFSDSAISLCGENPPRVAVGSKSPYDDNGNSLLPGYVRIYELNVTGHWTQVGNELKGTTADDRFGSSVFLSGSYCDVVAVGAPFNDANGTSAGQVRMFKLNGSLKVWEALGNALVGPSGEEFGRDIRMDATTWSDGTLSYASLAVLTKNRVRLFQYSTSSLSWEQSAMDLIPQQSAFVKYYLSSFAVASSSNYVAVEAGDDVYVYANTLCLLCSYGYYWHQGRVQYTNGGYYWDFYVKVPKIDDSISSLTISNSGMKLGIGYKSRDAVGADSGQVRAYKISKSGSSYSYAAHGANIDGNAAGDELGSSVSMTSDGTRIAASAGSGGYVQVLEYRETPNSWVKLGDDIQITEKSFVGYMVSLEKSNGDIVAVGVPGGSFQVFKYGTAPPPPPPSGYPPPPSGYPPPSVTSAAVSFSLVALLFVSFAFNALFT